MPDPSSARFAEKVCLLEEALVGHLEFLFPLSWIKDVKLGELLAAALPHAQLTVEEKASLASAAFHPLTLHYQRRRPESSG